MRDYSRFSSTFWTRGTGKTLRGDHLAQALAVYLVSAPSANMIGLYYMPVQTMAHDLGSPLEGATKALRRLSEGGFCTYSEASEMVFVTTMAPRQLGLDDGKAISDSDKRHSAVIRLMRECSDSLLLQAFWNRHHEQLSLPEPWWSSNEGEAPPKPHASPSEAPPKPSTGSGSGESTGTQTTLPGGESSGGRPSESGLVFDYWSAALMPTAKKTEKRLTRIKARLKEGFTVEQLCQAIDGAKHDPWLMGDDPKSRQGGYRDVETVLRDAAQVERLMALADEPEEENHEWAWSKRDKPHPKVDLHPDENEQGTGVPMPTEFADALKGLAATMRGER